MGSGKEYTMATAFTTGKSRSKAGRKNYPCYNHCSMKWLRENRKQSFRRAMIFRGVPALICLLICGLLPAPVEARGSQDSNKPGFSACCSDTDRFTARQQSLTLSQGKAPRRQANLAQATSHNWSSLIHTEGHLARTPYSRATYSSVQVSLPSDRAPPSLSM
jgi:hypothetical protein